VDKPEDFESTTTVLEKIAPGFAWLPRPLRERLTPAALWGALTALGIAITWLVNAQSDIHRLKDSMAELQQERDVLHKIDTQLAVLNGKVDSIAMEVDRQRQWRENIEQVAEAPPQRRRHP